MTQFLELIPTVKWFVGIDKTPNEGAETLLQLLALRSVLQLDALESLQDLRKHWDSALWFPEFVISPKPGAGPKDQYL